MTSPYMGRHQRLYRYVTYTLGGVLFIGQVLDTLSNANNLLSVPISVGVTVLVLMGWAAVECDARRRRVRWRTDKGAVMTISRLGPEPRLAMLGVIGVLWLPHAYDLKSKKDSDNSPSSPTNGIGASYGNGPGASNTNGRTSAPALEPPPPTDADRADWRAANAASNRCEGVRSYLRRRPDGTFVKQAETILAARSRISVPQWVAFSTPSIVTGTSRLDTRESQSNACRSARDSARRNADSGCQLYSSATDKYRNVTLAMADGDCDCRDLALHVPGQPIVPNWRCTVRINYQCRGETLTQRTQESCAAPSTASEQ